MKWYKLIEKPEMESAGIGIFPFIWVQDKNDKETIKHEKGHHYQQLMMLYFPWFVVYGIFWAIAWIRFRDDWWDYHPMELEMEDYEEFGQKISFLGWTRHLGSLFVSK